MFSTINLGLHHNWLYSANYSKYEKLLIRKENVTSVRFVGGSFRDVYLNILGISGLLSHIYDP